MLAKNISRGKSSPRFSGRLKRNSLPSIIGGVISGMISNAPLATPGLSATVVPVLAVLVRTHGVGGGALIALLFFVKRASRATRLEPIVPGPAEKEPSAINPLFKPRRNDLYQSSLFRFGGRKRLRSRAAAIKFKQSSSSGGKQP